MKKTVRAVETEIAGIGSGIDIAGATYRVLFHSEGGGIVSLIDTDGTDWVGHSTEAGSSGEYRGIPNLGPVFHPGYAGCHTTIDRAASNRIGLSVESSDRAWRARWTFTASEITFLLESAIEPYWFLYEGTPGGRFDPSGGSWIAGGSASDTGISTGPRDVSKAVDTIGTPRSLGDDWHGILPKPGWVAFTDHASDRAFYIRNYQTDSHPDQYWPMEGSMTVFGYGREYKCCERYLTDVPARFSFGFIESSDPAAISEYFADD